VTNDREIYEKAIAFGHYERNNASHISSPSLLPYVGLPLGGYKYRMHQVSSAVGRVQLRHYDARNEDICRAMHYFWDLLEGVPGLQAHRPPKGSAGINGGWYAPRGIYKPEECGGLSVSRFCEAVRAEGVPDCQPGCNLPLHRHPLFQTADVYGHGQPTRIAHSVRDVRGEDGSLPVSEGIGERVYTVPWFKHFRPEQIEQYARAYRKVAEQYEQLLPGDTGNPESSESQGNWNLFQRR
jgi:dTDP-4-amino-4,6-dideoxygalactose transaminase